MPKSFYTKLVGVTRENRQDLIAETIEPGDDLNLYRQPDNSHDGNAIAIGKYEDEIIGYLSRDVAAEIAPLYDSGQLIEVIVKEVTGQDDTEKSLGVNIEITIHTPEETKLLHDKYIQSHPQKPAPTPAPAKIQKKKPRNRPAWMMIVLLAAFFLALLFFLAAFQSTPIDLTAIGLAILSLAIAGFMGYRLFRK